MTTNLRSSLIRLAAENPGLRKDLLPLLKQAAWAPVNSQWVGKFGVTHNGSFLVAPDPNGGWRTYAYDPRFPLRSDQLGTSSTEKEAVEKRLSFQYLDRGRTTLRERAVPNNSYFRANPVPPGTKVIECEVDVTFEMVLLVVDLPDGTFRVEEPAGHQGGRRRAPAFGGTVLEAVEKFSSLNGLDNLGGYQKPTPGLMKVKMASGDPRPFTKSDWMAYNGSEVFKGPGGEEAPDNQPLIFSQDFSTPVKLEVDGETFSVTGITVIGDASGVQVEAHQDDADETQLFTLSKKMKNQAEASKAMKRAIRDFADGDADGWSHIGSV